VSNPTNSPPQLFEARQPIFPRRVSGFFRNLKWWLMGFTLTIYYVTPWLRWDRGPNLPDQAVLVDMAGRRFYMFWIEIWPYEFYFVAGLLIMAGLGLFLFTSALGRVWCGYACPQTVWTDLFILVERWIEGDRNARIKLWKQDFTWRKLRLRVTKWIVWALIAMATGGAWVFYFADAPTLLGELVSGQAAFVAYGFIFALTAFTFVFGGFMREQVCTYMCPWPRIQAAMMDEDTITIAYRDWRGEPRGKKHENTTGDCIDCMACVNVCPMGIDIRDGQQLECITCALCIDACDDVMTRIGNPRGLIDYLALTDEPAERAGKAPKAKWRHVIRARTILYSTLWSVVGILLVVALFIKSDMDITVSPVRNPINVSLSDGSVRNAYDLRLRNKLGEDRELRVSISSDAKLRVSLQGTQTLYVTVKANETFLQHVYITARADSPAATAALSDVRIWVEDRSSAARTYKNTVFHGKEQ